MKEEKEVGVRPSGGNPVYNPGALGFPADSESNRFLTFRADAVCNFASGVGPDIGFK